MRKSLKKFTLTHKITPNFIFDELIKYDHYNMKTIANKLVEKIENHLGEKR